MDEIQCGFGRTGKIWAFDHFKIVPDILLLGKALGGGMPLGAFICNRQIMHLLTKQPVLGHITTFGGHPVSCAAGMAAFNVLIQEKIIDEVPEKASWLQAKFSATGIDFQHFGLWGSIQFEDFTQNKRIIGKCIQKGLISDWFLFAPSRMRIAPPLIITGEQLKEAFTIIVEAIKDST